MEEWISVLIGLLRNRMKPFDSHTTTERTNRRRGQEFRTALRKSGLVGLGERQGKYVMVCWTGNRRVRERGQVSESQVCGEDEGAEVAE
jgi:hypothetical protein